MSCVQNVCAWGDVTFFFKTGGYRQRLKGATL